MKVFIITLVGVLSLFSTNLAYGLSYTSDEIGQDISWPNCSHLSFRPTSFGIVGVNGGLNFSKNPCIGKEASLYKTNLSLYINTGFPGFPYSVKYANYPNKCSLKNQDCLAYNYGYNATRYATNYAFSNGVVSSNWWLDVESINSWTQSTNVNISSLKGALDALSISVKPNVLGFYSSKLDWSNLTGNWNNSYPSWVASNSNFKSIATNDCRGSEFSGGKTLLVQYIKTLDMDLSC